MEPLPQSENSHSQIKTHSILWRLILFGVLLLVALFGGWYGWAYKTTPSVLQSPTAAHYHFRLQIINDGQPVNFASEPFQTPYDKFSCSMDLPEEPIHFHDNLDQLVHIHWQGITGGMVLKNYGWNEIGGRDTILGYRFDGGFWPQAITTHGNILPQKPTQFNYYLYTGDQTGRQLRNWQEFLDKDLYTFFIKTVTPNTTNTPSTSMEMGTTKIKNVVGNVVLFVQDKQPTEEDIQKYFDNLIPLPESTCGG